jgi:hypothetical protein
MIHKICEDAQEGADLTISGMIVMLPQSGRRILQKVQPFGSATIKPHTQQEPKSNPSDQKAALMTCHFVFREKWLNWLPS